LSIRVAIADDQGLVRAGFRVLVNSEPEFEVVGEASTGEEAVQVVSSTGPDVVLMDVRMPVMDGLEATRRILGAAEDSSVRVLMLTTFDLDEYVFEALRAGASGFLLKDTPPQDLLSAIRVVAAGDALLAPSVTRRLISEFTRRSEPDRIMSEADPRLASLTEREREVLVAVAKGLSNAEIGEALAMSSATAKTHVSRILAKLNARDRTQLVVIAFHAGIASST
jgi:DNA-binding NarL/FixJ family response regulator